MKKNYVLTLSTTEKEPTNKYYKVINPYTEKQLSTMDFIDFNYPSLKIIDTEENVKWFIELLKNNGFEVSIKLDMDYTNTSVISLEEFDNLLNEISDGKVGAKSESGEWFYVAAEDISDEEIVEMLGEALGKLVTNVIVDTTNYKVAIIY